jgi:hypothetical protein
MFILKAILGWFTGGGLGGIAAELGDAYEARLKATTDRDKLVADQRIAQIQARAEVQKAEAAGSPINAIMRAVIASSAAIFLFKVLVWDKALGQWTHGTTDALDPNLWNVIMVVLGFYFLYETVDRLRR